MKNFIILYIFKALSLTLYFIPRKVVIVFAKLFGSFLYNFFPIDKKILEVNLLIAFPTLSLKNKNILIHEIYQHHSILLFEFFKQRSFDINNKLYYMDNKSKNIFQQKNNFIILTAHIGNWELFLPIISSLREIAAIIREQKNLGADSFISSNRLYDNVTLISNKDSVRKMFEPLINNKLLLIVNDQNPRHSGTQINFFGKPTSFPRGAGHFYYKAQCEVAIAFCLLREDYRYELKIRKIKLDENLKDKNEIIDNLNMKYSQLLEEEITINPEQYCWFYKKWDRELYK